MTLLAWIPEPNLGPAQTNDTWKRQKLKEQLISPILKENYSVLTHRHSHHQYNSFKVWVSDDLSEKGFPNTLNESLSTSKAHVWIRFPWKQTLKTRCVTCSKPRCGLHQSCVRSLRVLLLPGQWWSTTRLPTVPSWRADMDNSRWERCFSSAASTVTSKSALWKRISSVSSYAPVH